ncbi:MAG: hypothetical protein ACT4PJ_13250 [Gemmatimonadaceae bacterium]
MRAGVERHLRQLERHARRARGYLGDATPDRHRTEMREAAGVP